MKNQALKICSETIYPGESLSLALPLPKIFSCAHMYMPIRVIHGKQAGPCMLVIAAMHGNELNGTEIVNNLLASKAMKRLHGTIIAVPVFNVYALINRSRLLPGGVDINRHFPGARHGSHAARIAHTFMQEIFSKADVCIDLRTGHLNYTNMPHVYVDLKKEKDRSLAEAFNTPVISHCKSDKGSLAAAAAKHDVPYLQYEAGEAMRFDPYAIKIGQRGIINVMQALDMLPAKSGKKDSHIKSSFAEKDIWVRAAVSGLSRSDKQLGHYVKKGDVLCRIVDPLGAADSFVIKSPADGIIVGINNMPLVHEGEGLFQLAVFPKMQTAHDRLSEWQEKQDQSDDKPPAAES